MQDDAVEVLHSEESMAAHRRVVRRDRLEGASAKVAGEDDVDDVLRCEAPDGRDRVDDCDGTLDGQVFVDADLLGELAMERVDEALTGVDAAAG